MDSVGHPVSTEKHLPAHSQSLRSSQVADADDESAELGPISGGKSDAMAR